MAYDITIEYDQKRLIENNYKKFYYLYGYEQETIFKKANTTVRITNQKNNSFDFHFFTYSPW